VAGGGRAPHDPGCCTGQLEATWSTGSISAAAGPAAPGAAGATVPQLVSFVAAQAGGCRGREPPPWAMATEPCSEPLATSAFCSRVAHKQGHYEATTGYWPLGLGHYLLALAGVLATSTHQPSDTSHLPYLWPLVGPLTRATITTWATN
jgi:hypothetical protein